MAILTPDTVAGHAYTAGFRGDALATIVAIAGAESGYDTDAVGDQTRAGEPTSDGRIWGPSIGLLQIRSINEENNTGRERDASRLTDPAFNMQSGYKISSGGTKFTPWSVFRSGAHRRHLDDARNAAGAVVARGGLPGSSGAATTAAPPPGSLGVSGDRRPVAGRLQESYEVLGRIEGFTVDGRPIEGGRLQDLAISAHVSLAVDQVSQITLTFADPRGVIPVWNRFEVDTEVTWFDLRFTVASEEWSDRNGVEILSVDLRAAGPQAMRVVGTKAVSWTNMSPTEVLEERAKAAGMRFYGKGTARRPTITRHGRDDTGAAQAESDWTMGQRLAREEGFWLFETADACYFAPPSWLAERTTRFPTRWPADVDEKIAETIGCPQLRRSIDTDRIAGVPIATGSMQLPPWRGYRIRPGMVTDLANMVNFDGDYLVTGVEFDLDGGVTPITIQVTQPIDPVPEPLETAAPGTTVNDQAQGGGADGQGPTGSSTGPYGYQYNDAGSTASGRTQPGTAVVMAHLLAKFPGTANWGTYVDRNVSGTGKKSVHAEGRAGDVGVPPRGELGDRVADYLVRNAPLLGIQMVIWNRRDWRADTRTWTAYTHPGGSSPTLNHEDHVHFELCWEAARGLTAAAITGAT